jgi:alpha-L-fucosidase 2
LYRWPTDEIGVTQTTDTQLLAIAKATVYALNDFTKWENVNGYCLSWPPAVRTSTRADSALLIGKFRHALDSGMSHNGNHGNGGGMLENSGATAAINEMLLQSHGGRMRFFPVWDATTLGAAAFTTLRAYGAFLVSAAIDTAGLVGKVSLWSEQGEPVVLESPFSTKAAPVVTDESTGKVVAVQPVPGGYWSFNTTSETHYSIVPQ